MFFKDSQDPVHISEVLKWGIFAGFMEGLVLALLTILYAKRPMILDLAGGWEYGASLVLIALLGIGAVITSVVVFAHPIYCLLRKHYRDALVTVLISVLTMTSMFLFAIWTLPLLRGQ